MAQKARKDRAKGNATALNNLHIGSAVVNILFFAAHFLWRPRSLFLYVLFSLPSFFCVFTLERTGRPTYDASTGALKNSGEDLAAPGLTEYMFDVIWVTWGCVVLVTLFGNWFWLLWAIVPGYGAYKGYSLLGATKQMTQMASEDTAPPAGNRKQRRAA